MAKTIEIDEDLYGKAEKIVKESGYEGVKEFLVSVLEDLVEENKGAEVSNEEKEQMKERLKKLGYIE